MQPPFGGDSDFRFASPSMKKVYDRLVLAGMRELDTMLLGESGGGKNAAARVIHRNGPRAARPFLCFDCSSVPRGLQEAKFFGVQRGAYTGADNNMPGALELAEGGILLLSDVDVASVEIQGFFRHFYDDRSYRRLGDPTLRKANVQIVVTTNKNLEKECREGRFAFDVFQRLAVFLVRIPPLRERREDLSGLALHFLQRASIRFKRKYADLDLRLRTFIQHYSWPGNVRELENIIMTAAAASPGPEVLFEPVADRFDALNERQAGPALSADLPSNAAPTRRPRNAPYPQAEQVRRVLTEARGRMNEAAQRLGLTEKSFYRLRKKLGIA